MKEKFKEDDRKNHSFLWNGANINDSGNSFLIRNITPDKIKIYVYLPVVIINIHKKESHGRIERLRNSDKSITNIQKQLCREEIEETDSRTKTSKNPTHSKRKA